MAFFIITNNNDEYTWHVPNKKPELIQQHIRYIMADGDELDLIIARFKNLPYTFQICIWRGDMAIFIYENLR